MCDSFTICPTCNQKVYNVPLDEQCEMKGCYDFAIYEAWFRQYDNLGYKTGLIQRYKVCEEHVKLSIGYENNGEKALQEAQLGMHCPTHVQSQIDFEEESKEK